MKLISCSIANFGTLQNREFVFTDGLNCVEQENGSGKTTLAAFIEAMLYGLESTKSNNAVLRDRAHYAPWNGGKFGGVLLLSSNGRTYRIERTFDRTSETKDNLVCYDTTDSLKKIDLLPCPGEYLLGIPKEAFLRTAFLSGKSSGSVEGIMPKINKYINGTVDTDSYSRAVEALSDTIKKYKPERRTKGSFPILDSLKDKIKERTIERNQALEAKNAAEDYEGFLEKNEKKMTAAVEKKKLADSFARSVTEKKTADEFDRKAEAAAKAVEDFKALHGQTRLSEEDGEKCDGLLSKIKQNRGEIEKEPLNEAESKEYRSLLALFKENPTTKVDINKVQQKITFCDTEEEHLTRLREMHAENAKNGGEKFGDVCPEEDEMDAILKLSKEYAEAKKNYDGEAERVGAALARSSKPKRKWTKLSAIAAIGGAVLTIVGIVFAFLKIPPWVILLAVGAPALIFGLGLYLFSDRNAAVNLPHIDAQIESDYTSLRRSLSDRLAIYGYRGEDLVLLCENLASDRERYLKRKEADDRFYTEEEQSACALDGAENEIKAFLARYLSMIAGSAKETVDKIEEAFDRYVALSDKLSSDAENKKRCAEKLSDDVKSFGRILTPYSGEIAAGDEEKALAAERRLISELEDLQKAANDRRNDAAEYRSSHEIVDTLPEDLPSEEELDALESEIAILHDEKVRLERNLDQVNNVANREEKCSSELERLEEELDRRKEEYRILSLTKELLETAESKLLGKYTAPMKDAYTRYASMIDENLCKDVELEPEKMSLCFDREGMLRKEEVFSSGFTALSDVCMRLAMIDVAYTDERPFLVLDDPFVYLDDKNVKKALDALSKLADSTQILYFTCHSSRSF